MTRTKPLETFQNQEIISEKTQFLVMKSRLHPSVTPIIIKKRNSPLETITQSDPYASKASQKLHQEALILKRLQGQGAPHLVAEGTLQGTIQMEDRGGTTLDRLKHLKTYSLLNLLDLAIAMSLALTKIHKKGVFHRNLCPAHFLISSNLKEAWIISFTRALLIDSEKSAMDGLQLNDLQVHYVSPELSGRVDKTPDQRADLYALGATLFEIFTGQPPFQSHETLTLVHSHIARIPPTITEKNPDCPKVLSDIVNILLEKNPEDRYQTASGLLYDLKHLQSLLHKNHEPKTFKLRTKDLKNQILANHKLFGRETAGATLKSAWERVQRTKCEVMWIVGPSGIGKSSVVRDFIRLTDITKTYIGNGKFQQYQDESTTNIVFKSLGRIIHQILTEDEERLATWKHLLQEATGPHGKLMTDILPDLQLILGEQPPLNTIPEAEAGERFRVVLTALTNALGKSDNPIILFLDDFHWVDQESTTLLETIIHGFQDQKVLFIGSYRNMEPEYDGADHPLIRFQSFLRVEKIPQTTLQLPPLTREDLYEFLNQTLPPRHEQDSKRQKLIADIIYRRTQGNPLFVKQQITTFAEADMFWSDLDDAPWASLLNSTTATNLAENVVDYILQKIDTLKPQTLAILQYASLLGSDFSLEDLAIATSESESKSKSNSDHESELIENLEMAMAYDLISHQDSGDHPIKKGPQKGALHGLNYTFNHDRIHQAIHLSIPITQLPSLHLAIGTRMAAQLQQAQDSNESPLPQGPSNFTHFLMPMLGHFLRAESLLTDPKQRQNIAKFCFKAMNKARAGSTQITAMQYGNFGLRLLGDQGWSTDYQLAFQLADGLHGAASLCGRFDVMDYAFKILNQKVRTIPELAHTYETKIKSMISQGSSQEAIAVGLAYVKKLGISIPTKPTKLTVAVQVGLAQLRWAGRRTENILTLPHCNNPRVKAIHQVLSSLGTAAYLEDVMLLALICLKIVRLSFKYGNDRFSPVAYCLYSVVLSTNLKKHRQALILGKISMELVSQPYFKDVKFLTEFYFYSLIDYLEKPLGAYVHNLRDTAEKLCQSGNPLDGHLLLSLYDTYRLVLGHHLDGLQKEVQLHLTHAKAQNHKVAINQYHIQLQTISNFADPKNDPVRFRGPWAHSEKMKDHLIRERDHVSLCTLMILEAFSCLVFRDYHRCLELIRAVAPYTQILKGLFVYTHYCCMYAHSLLKCLKDMGPQEKSQSLKKYKELMEEVYHAAQGSPENFRCFYELLSAEWTRSRGQTKQAFFHYQEAIIWAERQQITYMIAIIHEYKGFFWLELGDQNLAKICFDEAQIYFTKWGALNKVATMVETYPSLLAHRSPVHGTATIKEHMDANEAPFEVKQKLDLISMIQVSQTLSTYRVHDELLKKILKITLETAGATNGFLALREDELFTVKVIGDVGTATNIQATNSPLHDFQWVSPRIVQFVTHSKRPLLLDDAHMVGPFTTDPYVISKKSRSLICIPIIHVGDIVAILWLENKYLAHAFTKERMEILNIFAAQGAIALKNAEYLRKIPEKARLESQFAAARTVQEALLPHTPPPQEVSIALHYRAANIIGGDWVSYEVDDQLGYLYFCIGDMTGNGIPSALLTAAAAGAVKAALAILAHGPKSLSMANRLHIIAQGVNKTVVDTGNLSGRSMTMLFGALDLKSGAGVFLNAGHLPMLHFNKSKGSTLTRPGSLLGEEESPTFTTQPFTVALGDTLFLHTDGLLKNLGTLHEPIKQLDLRRLLHKLVQKEQKNPLEVANGLLETLDEKSHTNPPQDDCSFFILKLNEYR